MTFDPASVPRNKKERYLLRMSEDQFRDEVVRPLFLANKKLSDGRDLCGPDELGKDALFLFKDPLGMENLWAVQTKAGSLTLSSEASKNVINIITQLEMALQTPYHWLPTKQKRYVDRVILCASGKINDKARTHIRETVRDTRIVFYDVNDLITQLDEALPTIWLGIDAKRIPYLEELRQRLSTTAPHTGGSAAQRDPLFQPVAADGSVELHVHRMAKITKKRRNKEIVEIKFYDFPVLALPKRRDRLVMITGGAGSGKTTSLRRIAYEMAGLAMQKDDAAVPVLLRAPSIVGHQEELVLQMVAETKEISKSNDPAFSDADLRNGQVCVIIDALDEIATPTLRDGLVEKVLAFFDKFPKCQVILATRDYGWLNALRGVHKFARYALTPINWKQTTQLVKRLQQGRGLPEKQTNELLRKLKDVHGLQLNPLLVTVFVATSDASLKDVPANITELFSKYTEIMLGRWDAAKGFAVQYHAPLKDFLLRGVAARMHRDKRTDIDLATLKEQLSSALRERGNDANVDRLVEEIVFRSGLFRVMGDRVEFAHMLLQEFFAGRGLKPDEVPLLLTDDWWQRCLVFYFGANPDNDVVLRRVAEDLGPLTGQALLQGSVTLGLALQACYLLTMDIKRGVSAQGVADRVEPSWRRETGNPSSTQRTPSLTLGSSLTMP